MKNLFIKQLLNFMANVVSKNHWNMDSGCELAIKELIEQSVDKASFKDCSMEEMQQFAKTNLSSLLAYMHIDCQKRNVNNLDANSVYNGLRNFNCLWPFKGKDVSLTKTLHQPNLQQNYTWYY